MKNIHQSLAEQMQISDLELRQRKQLIDFNGEDEEVLKGCYPCIAEHIDDIVDKFYAVQLKTPEIAVLIGDSETLKLLRQAMRRYILDLFHGYYDMAYVNTRLRIGKVHKRIGVSPKLYLSAVWQLQNILNEVLEQREQFIPNSEDKPSPRTSLNKLITLDVQFVFDTYIASLVDEVSAAKEEMENYAASLEEIVAQRTQTLEELSRRDTLTGLFNQRTFYEYMRKELTTAARHNDELCLAYIDLNNFKELNDQQGHLTGDEILHLLGDLIRSNIRATDIPCRYGGDEFAIIMPRTSLDDAHMVCQRVIKALNKANNRGVTLSIGIINTGPENFHDIEFLVKAADKLMYSSKETAHNTSDSHITIAKPSPTVIRNAQEN